jgi:DDE superfamily endonuclease
MVRSPSQDASQRSCQKRFFYNLNVHFHFTPTSASWLNQVEIWFGIFTRKTLSGASFQTTEQLTQAIEAFVTRYNKTAAPFIWRKREVRGAQLRNTIVNLRN